MFLIYELLKPKRFLSFSSNLIYFFYFFFLLFLVAGVYLGFFLLSSDYQQGEYYKIIYIHVPAAWMSLLLYSSLSLFSLLFLIYKQIFFFSLAYICSIVGTVFTLITLVTGSLWGKPMWGTFWVWDARLTSMLILFFFFLGFIFLSQAFSQNNNSTRNASILALIGFVNLPIVKYSVDWWNTLHQSSSVSQLGSSIHISILLPLFLFFLCYICIFIIIFFIEYRKIYINKKNDLFFNNF